MTRGYVTRAYEAIVSVQIVGPSGRMVEIEAAVDTGFTGELTHPSAIVAKLGLAFWDTASVRLAGDAPAEVPLHDAVVIWDGESRAVLVHCMEGNPLIGMHLLHHHLLTIQVVRDGTVTVEPLKPEPSFP